jgi:hypothetical protein
MDNSTPAPVTNTPTPASTPISLPTEWPGAFGIYKLSKAAIGFNIGTVVIIFLISLIANIALRDRLSGLGDLLNLIVQSVTTVALTTVAFAGLKSTKMSIGQALSAGFSKLGLKMVFLLILLVLIYMGTFLLFIVPWVIVFPRIILAPYLLVKDNLGIVESIGKSWEITKGHTNKVWGVIGVFILFAILCFVLVGIYFTLMYAAAWAILTMYLSNKSAVSPADISAPVAPVVPAAPVAYPQQTTPVTPIAPQAPVAPEPQQQTPPTA